MEETIEEIAEKPSKSSLNDVLGLTRQEAERIRKKLVSKLFPAAMRKIEQIRYAFNSIRDFSSVRLEDYFYEIPKGSRRCTPRLALPDDKHVYFSYFSHLQKYLVYLL